MSSQSLVVVDSVNNKKQPLLLMEYVITPTLQSPYLPLVLFGSLAALYCWWLDKTEPFYVWVALLGIGLFFLASMQANHLTLTLAKRLDTVRFGLEASSTRSDYAKIQVFSRDTCGLYLRQFAWAAVLSIIHPWMGLFILVLMALDPILYLLFALLADAWRRVRG